MSNIVKYILAVLVVLAVAQVAPEIVNAFLVLLLIGIIVMRAPMFQKFIQQLSTVGK